MHTFPGCFRHLHILPRGRMSQIHYPGQVRGVTVNMAADIHKHDIPVINNPVRGIAVKGMVLIPA